MASNPLPVGRRAEKTKRKAGRRLTTPLTVFMDLLTSPDARRCAWKLVILSSLVALTGNFFLAVCGAVTGGVVLLLSPSSPSNSGADLIAMLSTFTAVMTIGTAVLLLTSGVLILGVSPERFCFASTKMVGYMEATLNHTSATGLYINADGADDTADPNETFAASTNTWAADSTTTAHISTSAHTALRVMRTIKTLGCGDLSGLVLLLSGAAVLLYSSLVVVPLAAAALRLGRLARRAGGCIGARPFVYMPPHASVARSVHRSAVAVAVPVYNAVAAPARAVPQMH